MKHYCSYLSTHIITVADFILICLQLSQFIIENSIILQATFKTAVATHNHETQSHLKSGQTTMTKRAHKLTFLHITNLQYSPSAYKPPPSE